MNKLYVKSRSQWRKWLQENHNKVNGLWLIFYKKATGKPSIDYDAAVEEAICFGWIDSLVKKIDAGRYVRKFTPRNEGSVWSDLNKRRVKKVIDEGRMTKFGLAKIEAAKKNGSWDKKLKAIELSYDTPKDFIRTLNKNRNALTNFEKMPQSHKKRYFTWINIAKKKETRERRIKEAVQLLNNSKKLGLK